MNASVRPASPHMPPAPPRNWHASKGIHIMLRQTTLAVLAVGGIGASAEAALVNITINGSVGFNVIQGNQANVPDGAPVIMSFNVDSNVFLNSGSFPTRGYDIILSSFSLSVGGQPINIVDPQSTKYFVLRDNDPAVDGFFISAGTDLPSPASVNIPGVAQTHDLDFSVGYDNGAVISSLNILDAVGTYGLTGIGSFGWTVGLFGNAGAEYNYESMTISVVPAPGALMMGVLTAIIAPARRRRSN